MKLKLALAGLVLAATPAHADWYEAETANFIVKSRASEEDARAYALELARFDEVLRALQGMDDSEFGKSRANKVTVYRFGRPDDIAALLGSRRSGVAGFFISRAGASVGFAPTKGRQEQVKSAHRTRSDVELDPVRVLFHEYTHYFMMQNFPGAYPRWYVEGYAELMATTRIEEDGAYHVGDPPQYRAYQIFQMRDFPLEEMLDQDYELQGSDALQHYATGWLLTHYLSFNADGFTALRTYLKALAGGENSLEAARKYLGDLDALETQLSKYKKGPFPGINVKHDGNPIEVRMRKLSAAEEDAMSVEMELARGAGVKKAEGLIRDLEKLIARHGPDADLLELLAAAQLSAEQYEAADKTGEQLIGVEPENSLGWLARTYAAIGRIKEDEGMAEAARKFATKASALDREDPRPLLAYYMTYVRSGDAVPETAAVALETAYPYAGTDVGYRILLARQLLVENQLPTAKMVLMPVAFRGHKTAEPEDESDPTLSRVLKLVDSGDRDGALAMVDRMLKDEEDDGEG